MDVFTTEHTELSANLVLFCRLLRRHGLAVGVGEQAETLRALEAAGVTNPARFRLVLRTMLAKSVREQKILDGLFDSYWHNAHAAGDDDTAESTLPPIAETPTGPLEAPQNRPIASLTDWVDETEESGEEGMAAYSAAEVLSRKDFSSFSADEMYQVAGLVNTIAQALATRISRRYRQNTRRGRLDFRGTFRHNLRRGGEIVELIHRNRKLQKLNLVLLIDVSQSMDYYNRFLVQFIFAFQNAYRRIESFVFSTSMHRVTDILKKDNFNDVLEALSDRVPDWSGGTRIGSSLQTFLDRYGDDRLNQKTIVLILSDGWDTGEIERLEDAMRTIQRKAASIIWLNPLSGSTGYEPTCRGMEAALPYVDIFASAHNLKSLRALARHLARVQIRRR